MNTLSRTITKRAAKSTARHTLRGFGSKAKRQPLRSATLLGAGGAVGALAGWLVGRNTGPGAGRARA